MTKVNPYSAPDADLARPQQYGELKVLSARGRLGRLRYLAYSFAIGLAGNAITVGLVAALGPMTHSGGMAVLVIAPISIFLLVVSFFLIIQRLHDLNASGWLSLLMLVPFVNLIVAIALLFMPGTEGENRFGLQPPPNSKGVVLTSLIVPVIFVGGIVAAIAIPAYQNYTLRAMQSQVDLQRSE
jgi:uncharacterized membrane protein YhaH (DUF805 family)